MLNNNEGIAARERGLPKNDYQHIIKRQISFDLLDKLLQSCCDGICPSISKSDAYYLVDISMDGYVKERAYYYYKDNIFENATNRYNVAINRVLNVFSCTKTAGVDHSIFDTDYQEITDNYYHSCVNRKAYWTFLKYGHNNNHRPDLDYCGAISFLNKIKNIHTSINSELALLEEFTNYLVDNLHICNGLDLFRVCYFRQKHTSNQTVVNL